MSATNAYNIVNKKQLGGEYDVPSYRAETVTLSGAPQR